MAWTRRYDETEPQRVNRWLAQSGVCSRREAEALIGKGLVSIDGERVDDPGRKIQTGQTLVLADAGESLLQSSLSVVLHKPVGVVSSQPERGQVPAARLLTREALWRNSPSIPTAGDSLPPLGRLDMDSRGLLILSQDGVLAKALIGPESELEKEYLVRVVGEITDRKLGLLRKVATAVNGWRIKPVGSEGYRTAEVTLGGVDTRQLDSRTMAVRAVPGLYFIGEVVDVTGWLGGYNFQWAWASGWCAGQAISKP